MKFSNYLEQIIGVSIYPVVSLVLFVAFFTGVMIWIYSMNKQEIEYLENLPFKD